MKRGAGKKGGQGGEDNAGRPLRQQAEERLLETAPDRGIPQKAEDFGKLVHELHVHRIELEIQNEELIRARDEAELWLEEYTELYEFAPAGYFTVDSSGTIRKANLAGAGILRTSRSGLIGTDFLTFLENGSRTAFDELLRTVIRQQDTGEACETELTLAGTPPVVLSVRANCGKTRDECLLVATDITDRKRAETGLHEANRKLAMLSSITRHDIRNQLLTLRGFLDLARQDIGDPKILGYMERVDLASKVINSQIEFTKYYAEMGVNAPEWQDLPRLVLEAQSQMPGLDSITVTISQFPAEVYADALIGKVFYNLFENTLRHGVHAGAVMVSAREDEQGSLVIRYSDNGIGISLENKEKIFRHGFGEHTGLGLFLSREILAITGMTIRESGTPGNGALFLITVPSGAWRYAGAGR